MATEPDENDNYEPKHLAGPVLPDITNLLYADNADDMLYADSPTPPPSHHA